LPIICLIVIGILWQDTLSLSHGLWHCTLWQLPTWLLIQQLIRQYGQPVAITVWLLVGAVARQHWPTNQTHSALVAGEHTMCHWMLYGQQWQVNWLDGKQERHWLRLSAKDSRRLQQANSDCVTASISTGHTNRAKIGRHIRASAITDHSDKRTDWLLARRYQSHRLLASELSTFEAGGIIHALISGDSHQIAMRHRQVIGELGLAHVMAISGLHVAIMRQQIGVVLGYVGRCIQWRPGSWSRWTNWAAWICYAGYAQCGVPIMRAVSMAIMTDISDYRGYLMPKQSQLALCVLLLAWRRDNLWHDIGAVLSYSLTAVILLRKSEASWLMWWRINMLSALIVWYGMGVWSWRAIVLNGVIAPFFTVLIIPMINISVWLWLCHAHLAAVLLWQCINHLLKIALLIMWWISLC